MHGSPRNRRTLWRCANELNSGDVVLVGRAGEGLVLAPQLALQLLNALAIFTSVTLVNRRVEGSKPGSGTPNEAILNASGGPPRQSQKPSIKALAMGGVSPSVGIHRHSCEILLQERRVQPSRSA